MHVSDGDQKTRKTTCMQEAYETRPIHFNAKGPEVVAAVWLPVKARQPPL